MDKSSLSVENGFGLFFNLSVDMNVVIDFDFGCSAEYHALFQKRFIQVVFGVL